MSENLLGLKNLASILQGHEPRQNYQYLKNTVASVLPDDRALEITSMMDFIAPNTDTLEGTILGMIDAPAAKRNHHAYRGGLVVHLIEMWTIWTDRFKQDFTETVYVNDQRILEGIIYHDIHKAYNTFIDRSKSLRMKWAPDYIRDIDNESMTWATKSLFILQSYGISLDAEQYHALLWSEGGWAEVQPKGCSVLAKLLYLLDEYSGNVLGRIDNKTWQSVYEDAK